MQEHSSSKEKPSRVSYFLVPNAEVDCALKNLYRNLFSSPVGHVQTPPSPLGSIAFTNHTRLIASSELTAGLSTISYLMQRKITYGLCFRVSSVKGLTAFNLHFLREGKSNILQ